MTGSDWLCKSIRNEALCYRESLINKEPYLMFCKSRLAGFVWSFVGLSLMYPQTHDFFYFLDGKVEYYRQNIFSGVHILALSGMAPQPLLDSYERECVLYFNQHSQ